MKGVIYSEHCRENEVISPFLEGSTHTISLHPCILLPDTFDHTPKMEIAHRRLSGYQRAGRRWEFTEQVPSWSRVWWESWAADQWPNVDHHGTDPGIKQDSSSQVATWGAQQYDTCVPSVNEEPMGVSFTSEQRSEQSVITYTTERRNTEK